MKQTRVIRRPLLLLLFSVGGALFSGCVSDGPSGVAGHPTPAQVRELTIDGLSDDRWVYVSLETGAIVGDSPLGDAAGDAAWRVRSDWDVAFCGDLIRTNGGSSGSGRGSVQRIDNKSFHAIDEAPVDGYSIDTPDAVVRHMGNGGIRYEK